MITKGDYRTLRQMVIEAGYGGDIEWQAQASAPTDAEAFALEAIYVICNGGMKQQVGRVIFERVRQALITGDPSWRVFKNKLKCRAIDHLWAGRETYFRAYMAASDKLAVLRKLDGIGPTTCYHLAKNFGMQVSKPDRHLLRLAEAEQTTPQALCERLARETGDPVNVVDLVLWRACNLGILNSKYDVAITEEA